MSTENLLFFDIGLFLHKLNARSCYFVTGVEPLSVFQLFQRCAALMDRNRRQITRRLLGLKNQYGKFESRKDSFVTPFLEKSAATRSGKNALDTIPC
jgi:hypothetical protein